MAKKNRAAALDWQAQARERAASDRELDNQMTLLWYAAEKRKTNYPSADFFERAGLPEVAAHIREAYAHLAAAYAACPPECKPG